MSVPLQFYREQAASCAKAAANAALDNQRAIFLRSEQAWQTLADRTAATSAARAERDAHSASALAESQADTQADKELVDGS
jgi:hypothetical protein